MISFWRDGDSKEKLGVGIVSKWSPVLESTDIPKEYYKDVALLAQRVYENFQAPLYDCLSPGVGSNHRSIKEQSKIEEEMITVSLFILSRINLSKVKFLEAPFYFDEGKQISLEEKKHVIKIPMDDLIVYSNSVTEQLNSLIVRDVVDQINSKIFEGFNIWMYLPIQSISAEQDQTFMKINYRTRYSSIKE